ncbi:MAG TPA: archaeal proteasome endopeptidase complex subunit alpha [Candidatus Thorarchaeota archaeon]|nr:MAG: proteasome endopeptidase complex, archaeal, alpha subunit [Candidatus Thorarchaeota archaeon]RLI62439.1 MAG: proteasome endopeptidase complex, archaeal, alpha subunit [Candidatus Thorarchaeota archaeon]HDD67790.1 archaeal proteasome endopeptidase complex subunit alpha [Candidatus Thorarchaeota archaeon]
MFRTQSMDYDRAITVFSPEGRLYQVEYATEAVRHGPLAVGVKAADGVVLAGEKRAPHPLVDVDTLKKILLIDDHVGTAIAGLHADARKLIDQARVQAQVNRLSYDEPISIRALVVDICDTKQVYTQFGGVRPFGVSLLVGGIDDQGPQLYTTDPSGSFWGWKATAIGKESDAVRDFFNEKYKDGLDMDGAMRLALQGLLKGTGDEKETDPAKKARLVEIGRIDMTDKVFRILSHDEVKSLIEAVLAE